VQVRPVRPSLTDHRFRGDPWILDGTDGRFALCLGNYRLSEIDGSLMDLPSFNRMLGRVRHHCTRPRQ
jgi:hypothetical protein